MTIEYPDGRKEIIEAGGRKTLFVPSSPNSSTGETTIWHVDGAVDITHEDGSTLYAHSDGTTVATAVNGTVTVTDPIGSTIVKTSGGSPVVTLATPPEGDTAVYSVDSDSIKKVEHEGGDPENEVLRTTYWRADGRIETVVGDTTTTWKTNGEVVEETKATTTDSTTLEGTDRWDDATQTLITTYSNGMVRTTCLDGTYTMTYPDGSSMNMGKYGRTVMKAPDGSRATTISASNEFLQEYTATDGVKYSIEHRGIKLTDQQGRVLFSRAERYYWWAGTDKELRLAFPDGTTGVAYSDLSRIIWRKDASAWSIHADKSYQIFSDYYWCSPSSGHYFHRSDSYNTQGQIQEACLYDSTDGVTKVFHYQYTSGTGWEISLPGGSSLALDAVNNPTGSYVFNSYDSAQFSVGSDNRLTITYPDGYQCVYGSDLRMVSETKGGSTTSYSYSENGNYSMTSAGYTMDYHADHTLSAVHLSGNDTLYFDSNECPVSEEKGGAKRLQVSYTAWGYISTAISSASIIEKTANSTLSVTEDGSLRQDNPDGTYTIWKTNGEVECTRKDEEGQAWITSGILRPDGTLSTEYVSTQRTTYKADGSTEQLTRDSKGASTTTQPYNGNAAIVNPDGSSSEMCLDGSVVKTEADGTTFTLQADGKTLITEFTDGSVITRNADGSISAQPAQSSQKLVQDASGDWVASMSGNVTLTWKADNSGNIITRQPETLGSSKYNTITQGIDNKIILVKSDGTRVIKETDANGAITYVQRNTDGSYIRQNANGTITSRDANGVISLQTPEGKTYRVSANGTQTIWDADGEAETTTADGRIISQDGDQSTETLPNGVRITRYADKSLRVDAPDGSWLIKDVDGGITFDIVTESEYITQEGDVYTLPGNEGATGFQIRDTENAVEDPALGCLEETYQLEDGSSVEIYSSGTIIQRRPGVNNFTIWYGGEGLADSNGPGRMMAWRSTGSVQEMWRSDDYVLDGSSRLTSYYSTWDENNPLNMYTELSNGVNQKASASYRSVIIPGGLTLTRLMQSGGYSAAEGQKVVHGRLTFGLAPKPDRVYTGLPYIEPIWYYDDGSQMSTKLASLKQAGYKIVGLDKNGEIRVQCRDKVEELEHWKWEIVNGKMVKTYIGLFYHEDHVEGTDYDAGIQCDAGLTLYALTEPIKQGQYKITYENCSCHLGEEGYEDEVPGEGIKEILSNSKPTNIHRDSEISPWIFTLDGKKYYSDIKPFVQPAFPDKVAMPELPDLAAVADDSTTAGSSYREIFALNTSVLTDGTYVGSVAKAAEQVSSAPILAQVSPSAGGTGISLEQGAYHGGNFKIVRVDPSRKNILVHAATQDGGRHWSANYIGDVINKYQPEAVINGTFFYMENTGNPYPLGVLIANNTGWYNPCIGADANGPKRRRYYFALDSSGHPVIGRAPGQDNAIVLRGNNRMLIGGGGPLLQGGQNILNDPSRGWRACGFIAGDISLNDGRPKTVVAISRKGGIPTVMLVTAEGLSLNELAQLLLTKGADDAIFLDAGGSTEFYYRNGPNGPIIDHYGLRSNRPQPTYIIVR